MFITMKDDMKQRYRAFLRPWGVYYCEDLVTGKQETLKTRDKNEAYRLVAAKNETAAAPAFSLHLARVYWKASDPAAAGRTWQCVMDEILKLKSGHTHERWVTAIKDKAFDSIRNLVVMETRPEPFLRALENGTVCTNIFLRRVQNFALDMSWLPWPVLPKKGWPKIQFKDIIPVEVKHGIGEPVFDGTDPKKLLKKSGRPLPNSKRVAANISSSRAPICSTCPKHRTF